MCDQCSFTAPFKHLLEQHIKIKHEQFTFNCHLCSTTFKSQVALSTHMKEEHGDFDIKLSLKVKVGSDEQHVCIKCPFKTPIASALTYHMSSKHGVGEFPCGKCSFVAASLWMLKSHKAKHDRTLHCDQCAYETQREFLLKSHMSKKHGVGNHPCDQCNFVAHIGSSLRTHKVGVYIFFS